VNFDFDDIVTNIIVWFCSLKFVLLAAIFFQSPNLFRCAQLRITRFHNSLAEITNETANQLIVRYREHSPNSNAFPSSEKRTLCSKCIPHTHSANGCSLRRKRNSALTGFPAAYSYFYSILYPKYFI